MDFMYSINMRRVPAIDEKENGVNAYLDKAIELMRAENLDKIKKMESFGDDWNGTGGRAFSKKAINLFETIIKMLEKQPQIVPTGRNSLLMHYESEDKSLLAFEVGENRTEKVYIPKGNYSLAQVEVFTDNVDSGTSVDRDGERTEQGYRNY